MSVDQTSLYTDIEPEGEGHIENDEPTTAEQRQDPLGQNGPSYEVNQTVHGQEVNPGGSVSPNSNRSHADDKVENA